MNPLGLTLTSTTGSLFLRCPREFKIEQIEGYKSPGFNREAMIGTVYHGAMEAWHVTSKAVAMAHVKGAYDEIFAKHYMDPGFNADLCQIDQAIVLGMVECTPWPISELRNVEKEFHLPVDDLGLDSKHVAYLGGKIDGTTITEESRHVLVDHKTKGDIETVQKEGYLRRDFQGQFYFYLALCFKKLLPDLIGHEIDLKGLEYRLVKRPAIRLRQNETVDQFCERIRQEYRDPRNRKIKAPDKYYRKTRVYFERDNFSFMTNLQRILHGIDFSIDQNCWLENNTQCFRYGYPCRFQAICNSETRAYDKYEYVGPNSHPELDNVKIVESDEEATF